MCCHTLLWISLIEMRTVCINIWIDDADDPRSDGRADRSRPMEMRSPPHPNTRRISNGTCIPLSSLCHSQLRFLTESRSHSQQRNEGKGRTRSIRTRGCARFEWVPPLQLTGLRILLCWPHPLAPSLGSMLEDAIESPIRLDAMRSKAKYPCEDRFGCYHSDSAAWRMLWMT